MTKILIASDEADEKLGSYFKESQDDIYGFLEEKNLQGVCQLIPSAKCTQDDIISLTPENPFIFIAYTHGNSGALRCNGADFVSSQNSSNFVDSFFYSTACLTGEKLAQQLIDDGCKAFIGYRKESMAFGSDHYKTIFINCDNSGIKALLDGSNVTIESAYEKMKKYITQQIDRLINIKDVMVASELVDNREALICLGDKTLMKEAFI